MSRKNVAQIVKTEQLGIKTATVSINVLQVDKKQMTLAVFRQLPVRRLFNRETGGLNDGVDCWGIVRYGIGDISKWVVFSFSGKLFRAGIDSNELNNQLEDAEDALEQLELDRERFTDWLKSPCINQWGDRYYRYDTVVKKSCDGTESAEGVETVVNGFLRDFDRLNSRIGFLNKLLKSIEFLEGNLPQLFIAV